MDAVVVWRVPDWHEKDAERLASDLEAAVSIARMALVDFLAACVTAGAVESELGVLWDVGGGRLIDRAEVALANGDLGALSGLLATLPPSARSQMGDGTMAAISQVLAEGSVRLVDVHWPEGSEEAVPETVTAEMVTAALADYAWDGGRWQRVSGA